MLPCALARPARVLAACKRVLWPETCGTCTKPPACDTVLVSQTRFRVLRLPFNYLRGEDGPVHKIDNVFKMCAILHNWLLEDSGMDTIGDMECDWKEQAPDKLRARQRIYDLMNGSTARCDNHAWRVDNDTDTSRVGSQTVLPDYCVATGESCPTETDVNFDVRRRVMVRHFAVTSHPHFDTCGGKFDGDVPKWLKTVPEVRESRALRPPSSPSGGVSVPLLRACLSVPICLCATPISDVLCLQSLAWLPPPCCPCVRGVFFSTVWPLRPCVRGFFFATVWPLRPKKRGAYKTSGGRACGIFISPGQK